MSERKVLNKYYPPDFDPSKIPRMKFSKNRQFTVRLMAPFNMRCKTCGEYIYKGKKFNARKEDVEGEDYLGIRIFRFYIKCTRCLQEISFKTDPKNTDYEIEAGATRNFMALKLAEEQAEKEKEEMKEEEASNPMKLLENRTKQSKMELELLESLEELKDLNKRQQNIDYDSMLSQFSSKEAQEKILKMQEAEDEKFIKKVFGQKKVVTVKEEMIDDVKEPSKKKSKKHNQNDDISSTTSADSDSNGSVSSTSTSTSTFSKPVSSKAIDQSWNKSLGVMKRPLGNLVKIKKPDPESVKEEKDSGSIDAVSSSTPDSVNGRGTSSASGLSMLGSYSSSDSE
ncbi:splicing factor YJU2 [Halyomorpha halys]|uniref:splicing factor YJU2 n=1 Tax=Halyomorpha halys TaxID=286706 RepID=UPI0006D51524|nr:coiled-coil domain-containing protein 94 [Halyomorpha halys]